MGLAGFASMVSMRMCDPMLVVLGQEFQVTTGEASRVVSAFAVAYGVLQLIYGPLGDRFGKLRVISLAVLACAVFRALTSMAPNLSVLGPPTHVGHVGLLVHRLWFLHAAQHTANPGHSNGPNLTRHGSDLVRMFAVLWSVQRCFADGAKCGQALAALCLQSGCVGCGDFGHLCVPLGRQALRMSR